MNTNASAPQPTGKTDATFGISRARLILRAVVMLALPAVILFVASGRLNWGMAWVYVGLVIVSAVVSRMIMARKHPGLIAERAHTFDGADTKAWDKVLVPIVAIFGPLAILVVAGLDKRFGWSPEIPLTFQVAALILVGLRYLIGIWAIVANKFFSAVVRIQKERGHTSSRRGLTAWCAIRAMPAGYWPIWPYRSCWLHCGR